MYLEMNDWNKSLVSDVKDIDFEYQAEEWIIQTIEDPLIVSWELKDGEGGPTIAKWERPKGSIVFPKKNAA